MIRALLLTLGLMLALPLSAEVNPGRAELDAYVNEALAQLYKESSAARDLSQNAKGILVFPRVYKAGFVFGGEYGEGSLLINNQPVAYYNIASASVGFQLGAQRKAQIIMFMTDEALNRFRSSRGWEVGVDGSVAIATLGAGGTISSQTLQQPIIGFIFSNKGLMYNLTLEGSKITEIAK